MLSRGMLRMRQGPGRSTGVYALVLIGHMYLVADCKCLDAGSGHLDTQPEVEELPETEKQATSNLAGPPRVAVMV